MHARMLRRVQQVHGHKLIGSTLVAFIPCQATHGWNSSPIFPLSWQAPVIGRNAELHISLNLSPDVKIGTWESQNLGSIVPLGRGLTVRRWSEALELLCVCYLEHNTFR